MQRSIWRCSPQSRSSPRSPRLGRQCARSAWRSGRAGHRHQESTEQGEGEQAMRRINDVEFAMELGQQVIDLVEGYLEAQDTEEVADADFFEMVFLFTPSEHARARELYEHLEKEW